jgi:glycerol-3-phosphate dehydrogenase subunit B
MTSPESSHCELAIIGTGLAGIAAAVFAADHPVKTVRIGVSGGLLYAGGYLDLLGVHPMADQKTWEDPWQAIAALVADQPEHPYARLAPADIRRAMDRFLEVLAAAGLPYQRNPEKNTAVITPIGSVKPTYAVPATMWAGAVGLQQKPPGLIVDFEGLKGFSAVQITEMLRPRWPDLRATRIAFPEFGPSPDLFPEPMAWALEVPANRALLADRIRPALGDAQVVGLPAVLGMERSPEILADLQTRLGVAVFEIPTIPPAMTGLRLKEKLDAHLAVAGVGCFSQKRVIDARLEPDGRFRLSIGERHGREPVHILKADAVILAGGRFLGMGLHAERKGIREPLFDLPVFHPQSRALWYQEDFFDPAGHEINRAGLEIDADFHPLDRAGQAAFPNLFAAGSILAHADWMRQKCGAGLAIATAYGAVQAFLRNTQS